MTTYTCCNKLFTNKGREVASIIAVGHVYSKVAAKTLEDDQSKTNTHRMITFNARSTRFLVEEIENLAEVRPLGQFTV